MFSLIKINAKAGKAELINTQQTGKFLSIRLVYRPTRGNRRPATKPELSDFRPKAGDWL